jgi:hypothetical protein
MKTHLLCLFLLFLFHQSSNSQSDDRQWLIWDGKGKNGSTTSPPYNTFGTSPIGAPFTLRFVSTPNVTVQPSARNALFIIYNDGSHFNTINDAATGLFYQGPRPYPDNTNHTFTLPGTTTPKYMYLTNRYEGDDDPATVRAVSSGFPGGTSNSPGQTLSPILSSTHNVALGRDITLIINLDSIQILSPPNQEGKNNYTLEINKFRDLHSGTTYTTPDFMDLKDVFKIGSSASAVYSNVLSGPGPNSIDLNVNSGHYEYVNLRNNSYAGGLGPTGDIPNYEAIFTIMHNGAVVREHRQPILNSYDPNFLQVLSITEESDHYIVKYHLEFENTSSSVEADTLKVKIILPQGFQLPHHIEWFAKHLPWDGDMDPIPSVPNGYEFTFNPNASIIHTVGDPNSGSAFIEFDLKVTGIDVANASNSLRLGTPTVQFDSNDPYPVVEFRDLVKCVPENSRLVCARPVTMATSKCLDMLCWVFLFAAIVITIAVIIGLLILLQISRNSRSRPRP